MTSAAGLVVMGRDSFSKGREFESIHRIVERYFSQNESPWGDRINKWQNFDTLK